MSAQYEWEYLACPKVIVGYWCEYRSNVDFFAHQVPSGESACHRAGVFKL